MRVVGFDPGLRRTGWGIIVIDGARLQHIANGVVESDERLDVARRLVQLHEGIAAVIRDYGPEEAAVEATLANKNASSTLKLGLARGVALMTPAAMDLPVAEYLPNIVKKAVVGTGHATKDQVGTMVRHLLPACPIDSADAADALAVAICHSHHRATNRVWSGGSEDPLRVASGRRS